VGYGVLLLKTNFLLLILFIVCKFLVISFHFQRRKGGHRFRVNLIYKFTTSVCTSDTTVLRFNHRQNRPGQSDGRTDRFCMGEPAQTDGLCIISTNARFLNINSLVRPSVRPVTLCVVTGPEPEPLLQFVPEISTSVRLSVTTGRREK
jgi:hypothetical protein